MWNHMIINWYHNENTDITWNDTPNDELSFENDVSDWTTHTHDLPNLWWAIPILR